MVIAGIAATLFLFLAGVGRAVGGGRTTAERADEPGSLLGGPAQGLAGVRQDAFLFRLHVRARRLCLSIQPPEGGHPERDGAGDRAKPRLSGAWPAPGWARPSGFRPPQSSLRWAMNCSSIGFAILRTFAGFRSSGNFQPSKGRGTFTMLPWSAFRSAGAVLGTAIDGSTEAPRAPFGFEAAVAGAGATLFAGGVWKRTPADALPRRLIFWTILSRLCGGAGGAYAGDGARGVALGTLRPWRGAPDRSSPLETFGTWSLSRFIGSYVGELVYGFASRTLRRQLTPGAGSRGRGLPWAAAMVPCGTAGLELLASAPSENSVTVL